jgi:hypothetical protein
MPTREWSGVDTRLRVARGEQSEPALRIELPCDAKAPATARDGIRDLDSSLRAGAEGGGGSLGGSLGLEWIVGDAVLVASELVTETVLHSGCAPDGMLAVEVTVAPGRLLVSVEATAPRAGDDRADPSGASPRAGSGDAHDPARLRIVERLSRQWGRSSDARALWAELALPRHVDERGRV